VKYRGIEICCPSCRSDLEHSGGDLKCLGCRREYPIIAGIPDLRLFPDPYIDMEADRKKGLQVEARMGELNFSELVDYYYSMTSVVPPQHARQYKNGLLAAVDRAKASLSVWHAASGTGGGQAASVLDVGCGTAPLLVAAAPHAKRLAGVDVAFRWLMIGKKRLLEAGLDIPLFCACAEALPFPDGEFARVILDSSIEHWTGQKEGLEECHRVMGSGGHLFLSTPNRYSLGPDPHMGVPAGGYWPKRWQSAYARRQGAIPPKRNLLSKRSLVRLTSAAGFFKTRLLLPQISEAQRRQASRPVKHLADLYQTLQKLPLSHHLLFLIGPALLAVARKPETPKHQP